jgi:putative oxidoreductase
LQVRTIVGVVSRCAWIKEVQGRDAVAQVQTKLLYPGLTGFYETMLPIAGALVRIVVGIMFLMHVSTKFKLGADAVAANVFAKNGIEPALMWAYVIMFLELVGGICLIIGLFTRFVAAALAIEMLVALLFVHLAKGYAAGGGGFEYVLLIGAVCFLIAIRGGGPYSVDRFIGKEL